MARKSAKKAGHSVTRKSARKTGKKNRTLRQHTKLLKKKGSADSLKILIDCKKTELSAGVFKTLRGMGIFKKTRSIKTANVVITDKRTVKTEAIEKVRKGTVILIVPKTGTEKAGVVNGTNGKKVRVFHMKERLIGLAILGITLQKLSAHVHES